MELRIDIAFLKRFIRTLGEFLGDSCEIVVHDYRNGFDHTIIDIVNGYLSGRTIGDSPRGALIITEGKYLSDLEEENPIYFFNDDKGRTFRSCTIFITDDYGKIEGSICINYEITELLAAQNIIQNFTNHPQNDGVPLDDQLLIQNVDEFLKYYLNQCEELIGKPMPAMTKDEKVRALKFLDQKGVFKISKASILLCEIFNISKFTFYNYLEEARSQNIAID